MDNREIGTRIRLARRDAGLTQEKLAEKIGVSTVFVSQLESGSRAPGLETLVKLSRGFPVLTARFRKHFLSGVGRRARRRRGSVSCCVGAGALAPPAYAGGQPGAKPVCRDGPFGCRAAGMLTHAFFEKGGRARPGERVKRCVERISGRETALCAARRTYEKTARGTKCCSAGLFSLYNIIFEESGRRFVTAFAGPSAPAGAQHPSARARWPRPAAPFRVWAGPCPAPSQ